MLNRACRILQSNQEDQSSTRPSQSGSAAAAAGLSSDMRIYLWKRIMLKINLLFQMIAMHVKTKTILGETAFNSLFPQGQQSLSAHQKAPTQYRFIKGQVVGQPLTRGEGRKDIAKAHMDPVMCQHPVESMIPRGNKTSKWWTCQKCQSRWARLETPDIPFAQDQDLILFGKHAGTSYQEMLQQDPEYCNWVLETVQNAGQEI